MKSVLQGSDDRLGPIIDWVELSPTDRAMVRQSGLFRGQLSNGVPLFRFLPRPDISRRVPSVPKLLP